MRGSLVNLLRGGNATLQIYLPSSNDIIHCSTYSLRLNPLFWAMRCNFSQELGVINRLCLVFFSSCKTGMPRNLFLPFPVDILEVMDILYIRLARIQEVMPSGTE